MQINWESFITYNQDSRGVRYKFEDLCRQLFINENLSDNMQYRYLHANPNNYGLEAEPIFDEINKRWIGFQAKFFDGDVDYSQIKHSAEETIKYYTGQAGSVDLVYLFCNKPITTTAKSYVDTVNLLKASNIEIQLITDSAILDLVRNNYPYLAFYYFGNHTLKQDWFAEHTRNMFEELGERYNTKFNVNTEYFDELSLFIHDQRAAAYLNEKKIRLIGEIEKYERYRYRSTAYFQTLKAVINDLPDVSIETLCDAENWADTVRNSIHELVSALKDEQKKLERKREERQIASDSKRKKEDRETEINGIEELENEIITIDEMINLPDMLEITDRERQLLHGNVLTLHGKAGAGKSQLLAVKTRSLIDEQRVALLLVAGIYFTDDPIHEQIMRNLGLDCSLEDLIDILEAIGERENRIVPVFIDAINETWNKKLWKSGLSPIIEKIRKSSMVRLVVSYRTEYEKIVLPDSVREGKRGKDVTAILHRGFENNSIDAVREFMDHYGIPFTPLEYFGYEMSNPLFLTLYCKTYNGEEVSLPELYERIIARANTNIHAAMEPELRRKGYSEDEDLLGPLIAQIAEYLVIHGERSIKRENLQKLSYWSEYGLTAGSLVRLLEKEHILHNSVFEDSEMFYFAFDQMNDYYCAKAIIGKYSEKNELREYISDVVLGINDGELINHWNIDLFVNLCALYAEKYREECIDIIDALKEERDQQDVFERYVDSFQWRNSRSISKEQFEKLLSKYPCYPNTFWRMLIGNSVKVNNPLNADFLHSILLGYKLNRRDYLWTIYINKLTWDHSERVFQIVQMYNRGEKLKAKSEKQIELLLTLFGWLLTSSNRWLRDHTSKAMVEILKEHFHLCRVILEKFKEVDDPYIIQRLYGAVFGACCKRVNGNYQALAEYVYEDVFNQEKVYPDILLRDYARLIIEKFLSENPDYSGVIEQKRIVPPYISDPIPEIEDQHYLERDYNGAMFRLIHSMRFEGMGMYGDFGRYVFQNALHNFDVDDEKMFNYAVYYIFTELGFKEEYFGDHDRQRGSFDRHLTVKTERIGKKYQWITMYNMLARISDHCRMVDRWSYPEKEELTFEGAWEPYVRDFDPTLNASFMACKEAPLFQNLAVHAAKGAEENRTFDISSPEKQKEWLETQGVFLCDLKDNLVLTDENEQQWVCLTRYCDTGREDLDTKKLLVWTWLYAYFMTPEQAEELSRAAEKGLSIISSDIASHHETYKVFNREFPWSPSCKEFNMYAWVDARIPTGEFETITEPIQSSELSLIDEFIEKYKGIDPEEFTDDVALVENQSEEENPPGETELAMQCDQETRLRGVEKEIGRILHATSNLIWEEEYDATKETAITYRFPCAMLVERMGLRQLAADGFLYDEGGKLAAFDIDITQKAGGVVVRKDILDSFLDQTGMKLVWLVDAEKEIHMENYSTVSWSDWEAVFIYETDGVSGNMHRLTVR